VEWQCDIEVSLKFPLVREIFLVPNLMFLCVIVMELKSQGIFVLHYKVWNIGLLYANAHFIGCQLQVSNRFVGTMLMFLDGNLRALMCFIVICRTKYRCDSLCGVVCCGQ